jgi:hypothetical protein
MRRKNKLALGERCSLPEWIQQVFPFALFFCCVLETGSHYVPQAGLEFMILLLPSPECLDYRWALPLQQGFLKRLLGAPCDHC